MNVNFRQWHQGDSCRSLFSMLWIAIMLSGCVNPAVINQKDSKYNVETMARDWREQVRNNHHNPYEGYPADNDSDYNLPKSAKQKNAKYKQQDKSRASGKSSIQQDYSDEDIGYGQFPRYNPEDDNVYLDPKSYPLYMD